MKIILTDEQYNDLWDCLHKVRKSSSSVKVDKDALQNLLMDHQALHEAVKETESA